MKEHDTALLKSLAHEFNLSYTAFGSQVTGQDAPAYGTLTISDAWDAALEPAPISPIDAPEYALLSGTIKATYNAHRSLKDDDAIAVSPGIMSGNTGAYRCCRSWQRRPRNGAVADRARSADGDLGNAAQILATTGRSRRTSTAITITTRGTVPPWPTASIQSTNVSTRPYKFRERRSLNDSTQSWWPMRSWR